MQVLGKRSGYVSCIYCKHYRRPLRYCGFYEVEVRNEDEVAVLCPAYEPDPEIIRERLEPQVASVVERLNKIVAELEDVIKSIDRLLGEGNG